MIQEDTVGEQPETDITGDGQEEPVSTTLDIPDITQESKAEKKVSTPKIILPEPIVKEIELEEEEDDEATPLTNHQDPL